MLLSFYHENRVLSSKPLNQKSVGPRQDSEILIVHYIFVTRDINQLKKFIRYISKNLI